MFKLDMQSRVPIYEQLKSKICELAILGELKENDQLPSVRSLARDLGVNPNTVQKAYHELEREGIIYSITGKGSFLSTQLDLQLERQYLRKISGVAVQAKQCGIRMDLLLDAIRRIYEGEE